MEQCTIYSHFLNFEQIEEIIKAQLPKAKLERQDTDDQKSLLVTYKPGFLAKKQSLVINARQRINPSYHLDKIECPLTQNLTGMINYVDGLEVESSEIKNLLLQKIATVNTEMPFIAKPFITEEFATILKKIIQEQDAFVFTAASGLFSKSEQQQFIDKDFNLILDTSGISEVQTLAINIESKYYDQPKIELTSDQLERKATSETALEQHQVKINPNLPCPVSEKDVLIRDKADIIDRIYALAMVAVRGEGMSKEDLLPVLEDKQVKNLSPFEDYIIQTEQLSDQEKSIATWRYESLLVLLWAVGKVDTLKYPNEICDVPALVGMLVEPSRAAFEASCQLRNKEAILDALDLVYRMNWACVDARVNNTTPSGGVHPGIVYERHYSLNWLTNYRNQRWDDVSTDT